MKKWIIVIVIILAIIAIIYFIVKARKEKAKKDITGGHYDYEKQDWVTASGAHVPYSNAIEQALKEACVNVPTGNTRVDMSIPEHPQGVKQHEVNAYQLAPISLIKISKTFVSNGDDVTTWAAKYKAEDYHCTSSGGGDKGYTVTCAKAPECKSMGRIWIADDGQGIVHTTHPKGKG